MYHLIIYKTTYQILTVCKEKYCNEYTVDSELWINELIYATVWLSLIVH